MTRRFWLFIATGLLAVVGGGLAWKVAPLIDEYLFPVIIDVRRIPPDPAHPDVFVTRTRDLACWVNHIRKVRDVETRLYIMTLILPDQSRMFFGPIDGRTGQHYSSRNAYPVGYDGPVPLCVEVGDVSPDTPIVVEVFTLFEPKHHLWWLPLRSAPVIIPPMGSAP